MGIWSVDGLDNFKHKDGHSLRLLRLVHYVKNMDKPIGVRYLLADREGGQDLQWGQAYELDSRRLRSLQRLAGTMYIEDQFPMERVGWVEESLRNEGNSAFISARERYPSDEDSDHPEASPVTGSKLDHHVWARIHVHNVGQGDTIVLELADQQLWLVDARLYGQRRRAEFDTWMRNKFPGRIRLVV
jgi:hypothetical protein